MTRDLIEIQGSCFLILDKLLRSSYLAWQAENGTAQTQHLCFDTEILGKASGGAPLAEYVQLRAGSLDAVVMKSELF